MSELQKEIFSCIAKSDVDELKKKLAAYNGSIDFTDDNGRFKKSLRIISKLTKTNFAINFHSFFCFDPGCF